MNITVSITKSSHQDCDPAIYTYQFFSFTYTLLFCSKIKSCCNCCFPQQIRTQNTIQLCILWDCSSMGICFNMDNKHHILTVVYTIGSVSVIIVLLRDERSIWQLCLNSKINKFKLQLSQSYQRPQFSQTMSSRLQGCIQSSAEHLRWSVLQKMIVFTNSILDV